MVRPVARSIRREPVIALKRRSDDARFALRYDDIHTVDDERGFVGHPCRVRVC